MKLTRRELLEGTMVTGAAVMLASTFPLAALAESYDTGKLMEAGPLGDKTLGDKGAPVTVIEYASLTCGHCANFATKSFPHLNDAYIETGKVYYIYRDFPLDNLAFAAAMLARCAPEEKFFDIIDLFFVQQRSWAFTQDPLNSLKTFAKQIGFTEKSFEECLSDQNVLDGLNAVRTRAAEEFKVQSTPTFFINGEKHAGALSVEELDKIIQPLL